jgi:hypothetical protein
MGGGGSRHGNSRPHIGVGASLAGALTDPTTSLALTTSTKKLVSGVYFSRAFPAMREGTLKCYVERWAGMPLSSLGR